VAIRAGNEPGITQGMTALQDAFDRATAAQTRLGTQLAAIEEQQSQLTDRRLASVARVSKNEEVNMAEAITGMTQAETAYNAALAVTARIAQKSLMDYLS
jgi:flagellar hook-associated protein 3 FlgL